MEQILGPGQGPSAGAEIHFAAAGGHAVVLGFFKPRRVRPVRVVVDPATLKLQNNIRVVLPGRLQHRQNNDSHDGNLLIWAAGNVSECSMCTGPHLSLHVVDGTAWGIAVGSIVFIVHSLD